jgi:hypothetical protein
MIAEYRLTEMEENGVSAEEPLNVLSRELGIGQDYATALRTAWDGGAARRPFRRRDFIHVLIVSQKCRPFI